MKTFVVASTVSAIALACVSFAWQQGSGKLPPPYHTPSATNGAKIVERPDGARLQVPQGFTVDEFATGFKKPRIMLTAPRGDILVSDSIATGSVVAISDKNRDGKADGERRVLIEGLDRPYGLAFWKDYLYVGEAMSIKRYPFDKSATTVGKGEEIVSLKGFDKGHWTRSLTFSPKGDKLYIGVGSGSNASPDEDARRATILECNPDGSACTTFAAGIRNPTAINSGRRRMSCGRPCRSATVLATTWSPTF